MLFLSTAWWTKKTYKFAEIETENRKVNIPKDASRNDIINKEIEKNDYEIEF